MAATDSSFSEEDSMHYLDIQQHRYITPQVKVGMLSRLAPSLCFYPQFISIVFHAAAKSKRGQYSDHAWAFDSLGVLRLLEKAGIRFLIEGFEHIRGLERSCVFVGNHMSIMETLIMPVLVLQFRPVTFVVKESLLNYPIFKHVMRSRNPIAVTRTNPRQDLKTVMEEGVLRLADGISVIVFPQTTRSTDFDSEHFGSIRTKLAKKAGAPIIPVALKTDAWQNGKWSKDFGKVCPEVPVRIAFGAPLTVAGKGSEEHQQVADFISAKLAEWKNEA